LPKKSFRLIRVLQSEVWPEFQRAQRQADSCGMLDNLGDGGAVAEAKTGSRQLYDLDERTDGRGCEPVIGKERLSRLV